MIDIGVNFHNKQLEGKTADLIHRAKQSGVSAVFATGTDLDSSRKAAKLASQHPGYIYATAGLHPHNADKWNPYPFDTLAELWKNISTFDWNDFHANQLPELWTLPSVVAIGECGLDYNRMFSTRENQLKVFEIHVQAAIQHKKPLFLHNRDSFEDFRAITSSAAKAGAAGVVHCFTGSLAEAKAHLDDGFHLGITGWVTEKRGETLREAVRYIPLDRLHLETDAPYLSPKNNPKRGPSNEPAHLIWVAKSVAEVKGLDVADVYNTCTENSRRLFNLPLAQL